MDSPLPKQRNMVPRCRRICKYCTHMFYDLYTDSITIVGEKQGQKFVESNLQLTACYTIEQYSCTETQKYQRIIRNPIHINAGEASKISAIEDNEKIPRTSFDFASIDQLYAFLEQPSHYPDFCGKYRRQTLSNKKNGDPFLLLGLTDTAGQEITVTIWKECMENPEKLDTAALSAATPDTIIAVTNIKPAIYTGALKMSSTDATHVIIDPPLNPESRQYQQIAATSTKSSPTTTHAIMTLEELQSKTYEAILLQHKGLSDGTTNLEAMAADSCIQKLIGRTCKQIIMEDSYEDRKTLPPYFKKEGMNTHRFHIEMTRKSTPSNINFIIVNKESLPNQSPPSQPIIPAPNQLNTPPTAAESAHTTPPPHTPTTPTTVKKPSPADASTTDETSRPRTARQLSFESPDPKNSEETATTTDSRAKRKETETTDNLQTINPTKRERFPE